VITHRDNIVPVFSIPPDWSSPVRCGEDWGGIIIEALTTREQRLGDRHRAPWTTSYRALTLTPQEMGYIRKVLETPAATPFACGYWHSAVRLASDAAAGTTHVTVDDATGAIFDVLPYAMIWTAFDRYEALRVSAVIVNQIHFATGLTRDWPAGAWVVPVAVGRLERPEAKSLTDASDEFTVTFSERFAPGPARQERLQAAPHQPGQDVARDRIALDGAADSGWMIMLILSGLAGDRLAADSTAADGHYSFAPVDYVTLDPSAADGGYTRTVFFMRHKEDIITFDSSADSGNYNSI